MKRVSAPASCTRSALGTVSPTAPRQARSRIGAVDPRSVIGLQRRQDPAGHQGLILGGVDPHHRPAGLETLREPGEGGCLEGDLAGGHVCGAVGPPTLVRCSCGRGCGDSATGVGSTSSTPKTGVSEPSAANASASTATWCSSRGDPSRTSSPAGTSSFTWRRNRRYWEGVIAVPAATIRRPSSPAAARPRSQSPTETAVASKAAGESLRLGALARAGHAQDGDEGGERWHAR